MVLTHWSWPTVQSVVRRCASCTLDTDTAITETLTEGARLDWAQKCSWRASRYAGNGGDRGRRRPHGAPHGTPGTDTAITETLTGVYGRDRLSPFPCHASWYAGNRGSPFSAHGAPHGTPGTETLSRQRRRATPVRIVDGPMARLTVRWGRTRPSWGR